MAGAVEGFLWALLGTGKPQEGMLLTSAAIAFLLLITGTVWFRRRERTFVDAIGSGGR
jgi:lipopolysaccharide transport system permease protein